MSGGLIRVWGCIHVVREGTIGGDITVFQLRRMKPGPCLYPGLGLKQRKSHATSQSDCRITWNNTQPIGARPSTTIRTLGVYWTLGHAMTGYFVRQTSARVRSPSHNFSKSRRTI